MKILLSTLLLFWCTSNLMSEQTIKKRDKPNRLIQETSPYLLQHAYNPVDWYPWGEEALEKARKENKPIFLSVGYSACHWCHVMERESFESAEVAEILNKHYICIKVDREERPDIDDIYMSAVQSMTGSGGWPMTVFMTPEEKPFYAGTYFPKEDKYGRVGFLSLAQQIHEAWKRDEKRIRGVSSQIVEELDKQLSQSIDHSELNETLLFDMLNSIEKEADEINGGFGGAPKFPGSMTLQLYIEGLSRFENKVYHDQLSNHLKLSLRKMAQGGMYDQIGGGFHRYSTDEKWLVPHFEKMLYDNALLATLYFEASQTTDRQFNVRIGREICDYVLKEMTHESGAFYSTTDADSEGMEGKFFLWDRQEIQKVLGDKAGATFCDIYEIKADPMGSVSFEGGTPPHQWFKGRIPHLSKDVEVQLNQHDISMDVLRAWKSKLWKHRQKRIQPGKDMKVLSSWNGLMVIALCHAYISTGEVTYLNAAEKNLDFLWKEMQEDGRVKATWKDGEARHFGTLEDYANLSDAYLSFFRVSGDFESFERALVLVESVIDYFSDEEGKAFFYTAKDAEKLIIRSKNPYDNAVPAGNSVMAGVLYRLFILTGDGKYLRASEGITKEYSTYLVKAPQSFPRLGRETVFKINGIKEYVLLGASEQLKRDILQSLPYSDIFLTESGKSLKILSQKKSLKGNATLYICRLGVCEQPIVGEDNIRKALNL